MLAVDNYRSLRELRVPLTRLNVVTGANGTGKSNLYRALRLLTEASRNGAPAALAREGGLPSTVWAGGGGGRQPVALRLGFGADDFGYTIDLGLAPRCGSAFALDPEIKRECIWAGPTLRPAAVLADRHNDMVRVCGTDGTWAEGYDPIEPFDSMLSEYADPLRAPETINEIGDAAALAAAVDDALPGTTIEIEVHSGRFELNVHQSGLTRPLRGAELSEVTLRCLLWVAALLSPRPPPLLVLNEPETSLHPQLLGALAAQIVACSETTQVIVVSHSRALVDAIATAGIAAGIDVQMIELTKAHGETSVAGQQRLDLPPWHWPKR